MIRIRTTLTCLALFLSASIFAQKGILTGKVFDTKSGEGLIGASVSVKGTQTGIMTDIDGNYRLELSPGTYTIVAKFISYTDAEITNVVIKENELKHQDFGMTEESVGLDEVVITAKKVTHTENAILSMQKKAPSVINAISTQEIARNGDSQAASALKRVSGVSVEGGKYVYVRGLSDRYSLTTLNRAEIPGLDPNRNTVQMDLFPSNIINALVVHKTFSAELPGSFCGGYVNIQTKDLPSRFNMKFSTSLGYNTNSSLRNDFLTYEGGKTDFLAVDDGTRAWPVEASEIPTLYQDNDGLDNITRSFSKEMDVRRKSSFLNHGHSFSIGNRINKEDGRVIGYNGALSYSRSFKGFNNGELGRYKLVDPSNNELNTERRLDVSEGSEEVLLGALFGMSYQYKPNHRVGFVAMHNRSGDKTARYLDGERPSDEIGSFQQTRELSYVERAISSFQVKGNHNYSERNNLRMNWMTTFTSASQKSPDLRFFTNSYFENEDNTTSYLIERAKYSLPGRYTRDINEFNIDGKLDFEMPIKFRNNDSKLKFGAASVYKNRGFEEQRIDINNQNNYYGGSVASYLDDSNIGQNAQGTYGIYVVNATELRNSYDGNMNVNAAYVLGDLRYNERLKFQIGARVEAANIFIESRDPGTPSGELNNVDLLPSLNANYELQENMNLRFAASRTIARPTFRELAPYASYNYSTGETRIGNEELVRTLIDNFDVRWERYFEPGELVSFGTFYKRFTNPIENTFNPVAANPEMTWKNIGRSNLIGLEFELRKYLSFISPKLENFKVGSNVTVVESAANIDPLELEAIQATDPDHEDTRDMFGQSPYVVNAQFGYSNKENGWDANVTYNVSGEKLAVVVISGTPNVYEQAFHSLNFNLNKQFSDKLSCRFSVKNILDQTVKRTYEYNGEEYIFNAYDPGQTFSLGVSYTVN